MISRTWEDDLTSQEDGSGSGHDVIEDDQDDHGCDAAHHRQRH
jgi:hypothetical protein